MKHTIVRMMVVTSLSSAPLLVACGGDDDGSATIDASASDAVRAADSGAVDDDRSAEADDTPVDEPVDTGTGDASSSGSIDGSDIDWATVDLTTIDWTTIDMSTVNLEATRMNPTVGDIDEDTLALIRQRYEDEVAAGGGDDDDDARAGSGLAILTIGDQTWEFEGFVCAWGFENTRSEVFSFSSNAFGTLDDGTRTQLQLGIWDDTGTGALTGPGTEHEVIFDDIEDFENPAVDFSLLGPEYTFDGPEVSVEGAFNDEVTGTTQQGSFVGECGPGSLF